LTQRRDRVHPGGAPRGNKPCDSGCGQQNRYRDSHRVCIARPHAEQERLGESRYGDRRRYSGRDAREPE